MDRVLDSRRLDVYYADMGTDVERNPPGRVRDAILQVLAHTSEDLTAKRIAGRVSRLIGHTPESSVRSFLRLNTPSLFMREARGVYRIRGGPVDNVGLQRELNQDSLWKEPFQCGKATLVHGDCFDWIDGQPDNSLQGIVTDPPFGLLEYSAKEQSKLRKGRGGVWRLPPSFDGHRRSPVPRFTTMTDSQRAQLREFFYVWGRLLLPKLAPGANVLVASNPLLSHIVSTALTDAGLEKRGEIIRLVMTMRGGDRPKRAHEEFAEVSVMPRSMWEPWVAFRRPIKGRVQDNLRSWKTGGFRRPSVDTPFGDVIKSAPTRKRERLIAPHPSLKPQAFLRQMVRAVLPLGAGKVVDPFAGAGSTLAAAEAVGYESVGVEKDPLYFDMAVDAIPNLAGLAIGG